MPDFFNPETAGTLDAVIGFTVSGAENFEAYLVIQDGTCRLEKSPSRKPDLMIRTPGRSLAGHYPRRARRPTGLFSKGLSGGRRPGASDPNEKNLQRRCRLILSAGTKRENPRSRGKFPQPLIRGVKSISSTSRKESPMKVLALNSSPRGEGQSQTEFLLTASGPGHAGCRRRGGGGRPAQENY